MRQTGCARNVSRTGWLDDSGTTLTYLPESIATAILAGVGGQNTDEYGPVVPCSVGSTPAIAETVEAGEAGEQHDESAPSES